MNKWARPFEWNSASASPAGGKVAPSAPLYFAFLSYSHQDSADADWLHRELERFRVPSSLAGRPMENGATPKKLTPIFRDRHELAAAADLGAEIRSALASSQFLIVMCSPAAAKSKWTNAEIQEFKRTRPDGCVLAAIVGGEPFASDVPGREDEECFPPALRQKYDKRGRPTGRRAEPLAADLRDGGDGRRLGFLKLVAGMLGVGLDELVQRETMRRQRRLAYIAAASLAGMAVTSTLAVTAIQARDEAREQRGEAEDMVGFMLGDLRERLEPLGRLDTLDAVGARALAYFEKQDKAELSDEALAQRSRALTLMGEIAQLRGDFQGALSQYREAMESTAELTRRYPDDPQRLFDHAQNVFWVGSIHYQRGRVHDAANAFRRYKSLADRLVALDPDKREWRLETIYADHNLGTALIEQKRYREASEMFERVLTKVEAMVAAEPQNRAHQDQLSEALAWLSQARENEGALDAAVGHRERQLSLLERQAATGPADAEMKAKMLSAHRALGRLFTQRGDVGQALRHFQRSVQTANELSATEPDHTAWAERRAATFLEMGDLQLTLDMTEEAGTSARTGCAVATQLASRDPTAIEWGMRLRSSCLHLRARLALARGAAEEAKSLASEVVALSRRYVDQPPIAESRFRLAGALLLRGQVDKANGDSDSARRAWRAALAAWPRGAEMNPRHLVTRALILEGLGYRREASAIAAKLQSMGFRHPGYERERRLVAA
jgi:eukaryotic-like serine/threonine-protein kinase